MMLRGLFNFKGRVGRATFWLGTMPLIALVWLIPVLFLGYWPLGIKPVLSGGMPHWPDYLLLPAAYLAANVTIKRLHDRNRSGWLLLLLLLPLLLKLALPLLAMLLAGLGLDIAPWLGRWGTANTLTLEGAASILFEVIPLLIAMLLFMELAVLGSRVPNSYGVAPMDTPLK